MLIRPSRMDIPQIVFGKWPQFSGSKYARGILGCVGIFDKSYDVFSSCFEPVTTKYFFVWGVDIWIHKHDVIIKSPTFGHMVELFDVILLFLLGFRLLDRWQSIHRLLIIITGFTRLLPKIKIERYTTFMDRGARWTFLGVAYLAFKNINNCGIFLKL